MGGFKLSSLFRSSRAVPNEELKNPELGRQKARRALRDSGYSSSCDSQPSSSRVVQPNPPSCAYSRDTRDENDHRWSEVVPESSALTFAAIWDPEEGIVAFSGAELLSLAGPSSTEILDSPTSPSDRTFLDLPSLTCQSSASLPTSRRTTKRSTVSPKTRQPQRPASLNTEAPARLPHDSLSQLLHSVYHDWSGGQRLSANLTMVRSRKSSLAATTVTPCMAPNGLTACTVNIAEFDSVTISTLAYFRDTTQRFYTPSSPTFHHNFDPIQAQRRLRHSANLDMISPNRASSAILQTFSDVPKFLRLKGSVLGRLPGYKMNRQFSCLENLDDGFKFDPLGTVFTGWEQGDADRIEEEEIVDDDAGPGTAGRRAVLFLNKEAPYPGQPRFCNTPPPDQQYSDLSITSWSALDMTDPFSTSQPKRLRKRRAGAHVADDTPVPPEEVLARSTAPIPGPVPRSAPCSPSRNLKNQYPFPQSTLKRSRSAGDTAGSEQGGAGWVGMMDFATMIVSRKPSAQASTLRGCSSPAGKGHMGKLVKNIGPRIRKMSYRSRRDSRMRRAGWKRRSEIEVDDERWVRIEVVGSVPPPPVIVESDGEY